MKRISALLFALAMMLGFSPPAQALLIDRGGGLIYDDVLNITWLQDANYSKTSGYDADGYMTWDEAMTWADQLVFQDYNDWRLPNTLPVDGATYDNRYRFDGSTDMGYNISAPGSVYQYSTGSEMAYMYYVNLGNLGYYDTSGNEQAGWQLWKNTGPFTNLRNSFYWSGTEYATVSDAAFDFCFRRGYQAASGEGCCCVAWAVRPGDSAPIPEPATMLLLGSGLLGLAALGRRRKRG